MGAIDLDEIERRIPSPATECAYCYRLEACAAIAQGIAVAASRAADYTANTLAGGGDAT